MKKILVTGSNGLLGQKIIYKLKSQPAIKLMAASRGANKINDKGGYNYTSLDITDKQQVEQLINSFQPDTIIHSAAMTNVDACEKQQDECWKTNVDAVQFLIDALQNLNNNCHFIQISTDFIFDGEKGNYNENDEPNPVSFYGKSKAEAEKLVMQSNLRWSIIRTILIYGVIDDRSRSNIVLWVKNSLEQGKEIKVINDQFRSPTLAEDLADGTIAVALKEAEGIFHISGEEYFSIDEIAKKVISFFKLDASKITYVSSRQLQQPARRPPKTGFDISKAKRILDYKPHTFNEGLKIIQQQLGEK
ncbi:MAG: SDR family oxidoreductase [Bacteroidia bacterium]